MLVSQVRLIRVSQRIPLYKLAGLASINPVRLGKIENLHVQPTPKERAALARALGLTETDVFGDSAGEPTT